MMTQRVTLEIPELLYQQLKSRAVQTHHTIENELLEVLATAVPIGDELPANLAEGISPLTVLEDAALWRAAQSRLPVAEAEQLADLHLKRQREGLTEVESQTVAALVQQHERAMLVRAQAIALLKQRGHDVSSLLTAV